MCGYISKIQIYIQYVWDGAQNSAFITTPQVTLTLVVRCSPLEQKSLRIPKKQSPDFLENFCKRKTMNFLKENVWPQDKWSWKYICKYYPPSLSIYDTPFFQRKEIEEKSHNSLKSPISNNLEKKIWLLNKTEARSTKEGFMKYSQFDYKVIKNTRFSSAKRIDLHRTKQ